MIEIKYGKRRVISYRGAKKVVGGLTAKNKIDILLYLSKELANFTNERELVDRMLGLCSEIFEPDNATFRLWDPQFQILRPIRWLRETETPRRDLNPGEGFSGVVFSKRESMLLTDLENYPELLDNEESTRSVVCVPIQNKDGILGTLSVEKSTPYFYKQDDLEILQAMASQMGLALNEVRLVEGLMEARGRLEADLRLGRNVQEQIVQTNILPWNSIHFYTYYEPMVEVSGDYFTVVSKGSYNTVIIADVAGHGVPAALVTMSIHFHFERCVNQGMGLSEIIEELGESIRPTLPDGTFFTAQIVRIYNDHSYSFVNAGHQRLVHFHSASNDYEELDSTGFPLGFDRTRREDYEERFGKLSPGDFLLLMTDGFAEQRDPSGQETGGTNIIKWLTEEKRNLEGQGKPPLVENIGEAVIHRFKNHIAGQALEDDLTMILIQCSPVRERAWQRHQAATKAYEAKNFDNALALAMETYEIEPSVTDNLLFIARLHYRRKEYSQSARFLKEFISVSGENTPGIHYKLGYILFQAGDYTAAKRSLKKALSLDHTHSDASLMLAKAYLKEKSAVKAIKALQRGLKSNPDHALLSQTLAKLKKYE